MYIASILDAPEIIEIRPGWSRSHTAQDCSASSFNYGLPRLYMLYVSTHLLSFLRRSVGFLLLLVLDYG